MPAELKIQVRFLLGALLETTRKRGFLCAHANLYAGSYNTALGALLEKEPFSDESGSFFMLFRRCFVSKMSKIRTKSIYC